MSRMLEARYGRTALELIQGDITSQSTDAIVNAANSSLMGGGGVDGAIHRRGGSAILDECREIRAQQGALPAGQAVITTGGRLPAGRVIHTVGPVWHGGQQGEAETLASCYRACLTLAERQALRSIAFPSISTGAYGYPISLAADVALSTVTSALAEEQPPLDLVRFVLFTRADLDVYAGTLARLSS